MLQGVLSPSKMCVCVRGRTYLLLQALHFTSHVAAFGVQVHHLPFYQLLLTTLEALPAIDVGG